MSAPAFWRLEILGKECDVLDDTRVGQFQSKAVEVLACLDEALDEPAFKRARAVLVLVKDRNEWRNYAERGAPKRSAAKGETP
jgi:hypothetical protein